MNLTGCNKPVTANLAATYTCSSAALTQLANSTATAAQVTAAQSVNVPPQPKSNTSDIAGPTMSFRICGGLPTNAT